MLLEVAELANGPRKSDGEDQPRNLCRVRQGSERSVSPLQGSALENLIDAFGFSKTRPQRSPHYSHQSFHLWHEHSAVVPPGPNPMND